jgi:hypothetical protein
LVQSSRCCDIKHHDQAVATAPANAGYLGPGGLQPSISLWHSAALSIEQGRLGTRVRVHQARDCPWLLRLAVAWAGYLGSWPSPRERGMMGRAGFEATLPAWNLKFTGSSERATVPAVLPGRPSAALCTWGSAAPDQLAMAGGSTGPGPPP